MAVVKYLHEVEQCNVLARAELGSFRRQVYEWQSPLREVSIVFIKHSCFFGEDAKHSIAFHTTAESNPLDRISGIPLNLNSAS